MTELQALLVTFFLKEYHFSLKGHLTDKNPLNLDV